MAKNLIFGPDFGLFGANLVPKSFLWVLSLLYIGHCCKPSIVCNLNEAIEPNLRKCQKFDFEPNFGVFGPNLGHHFISSKVWLHQSLDVMVSYHHVQYQKKLIIQNLETDEQMDRRTDRPTIMIS